MMDVLATFMQEQVLVTAAFVILYVVVFLVAKWLKDFLTPYSLLQELTKKDNLAVALTMCGYYLGIAAVFMGALRGPSVGLVEDLTNVALYSGLGVLFLNMSRLINDKIILRKFCNIEQLTQEHNVAVGAIQCGTYIATGLIAAGSVTGTGGGVLTAIVFFAIGQCSLLLFTVLYDKITPYSIHEELEKKNIAAGVALGGTLVALGIIILNGVSQNFVDWQSNITDILLLNLVAFFFLPLIRFMMDKVVIPGDDLSREIAEDQNIGAAFLEAVIAISFAVLLFVLL